LANEPAPPGEDPPKPPRRPPIKSPPDTRGRQVGLTYALAVVGGFQRLARVRHRAIAPRALVAELGKSGILARAAEAGLAERAVLRLAQRMVPDRRLDLAAALAELERAVEVALEVLAQGARRSNLGDPVPEVLREVAAHTGEGALDAAVDRVQAALADMSEKNDRRRAALLREALRLHVLRRDAAAVARAEEDLVAIAAPGKRAPWTPAFRARWVAYETEGRERGLGLSLEIAVELARRRMATAKTPDERGSAGILLGIALTTLGERESGAVRLEAAETAFREALQEISPEHMPFNWAYTQLCLGKTLSALGERDGGKGRLEDALIAYRAALAEFTRDRFPLEWAQTQVALGNALGKLGELESGTSRLKEAEAVFKAVLEERTRHGEPLDRALVQNNLGNVLSSLGEREGSVARLEEAVMAYRAALNERTRDRAPLEWATTQSNLGRALEALGERESSTALLEEAVAACRAAVEEMRRDWVPHRWAATQFNLGSALTKLGMRESGTARLKEAEVAFVAALEEWGRDRAPLFWALTQYQLALAKENLAERAADPDQGRAAFMHAAAALEEVARSGAADRIAVASALHARLAARYGTPP